MVVWIDKIHSFRATPRTFWWNAVSIDVCRKIWHTIGKIMHCLSLTHVISSKQRQGLLMYIQLEKRDIFKLLFLRWFLSIDCLILCVCVWAHECLSVHVEVRGEFIGLSFLLLSCGLWGIRSDSKTWQQAPLCTEPASSWLKDYFHMPTCQLFTHKHIKSTVSLSFAKMKHIIINKEIRLWGTVYQYLDWVDAHQYLDWVDVSYHGIT